jgi:hypothetical protein
MVSTMVVEVKEASRGLRNHAKEPETINKRQAFACACCLGSNIRLDPALRFRYRVS